LLNLMPKKIQTENQFARLIGATPLQIELTLIRMSEHQTRNTTSEHMSSFYKPFSELRDQKFDGLIITGAPIEHLEFTDVTYWDEMTRILDWSQNNVHTTMSICWGAQAAIHHFHGVPKSVTRVVHMCCGYPDHLDDDDYKKADPDSYRQLSAAIDDAAFDQVSIEDAHCCNDLNLLDKLPSKTVIFGAVAIASSRVESVDEVVARLQSALDHIDRDRLVVAPDCGLGLLPVDLAEAKLRVMCQAAALV